MPKIKKISNFFAKFKPKQEVINCNDKKNQELVIDDSEKNEKNELVIKSNLKIIVHVNEKIMTESSQPQPNKYKLETYQKIVTNLQEEISEIDIDIANLEITKKQNQML